MKLRIVIVDDEPLARARLRRLLRGDHEAEIVAECGDGPTAVAAVRERRPDLLLLDVQMPGMDGFAVLRALDPGVLPAVVFVTGFHHHAVRAFEARALDYLLKPTSRERLAEALARARQRLATQAPSLAAPLADLLREQDAVVARRFSFRQGERTVFVAVEEIDWIEAAGNYAILHVGRATHILRETMTALEARLPRDSFFRVSRSAIVNLQRVEELRHSAATERVAVLANGQQIPLTRSLREVEERLRRI